MRHAANVIMMPLVLTGCVAGSPGTATRALDPGPATSWLLPWGAGAGHVGRRETQPGYPGEGPAALAVGPDGTVHLLDQLNERVLRLGSAQPTTVAAVPRDMAEVAVGPDGAVAVLSPLRARVEVHHRGALEGTLVVPRSLRELRSISLGLSRQVTTHTAYQETYRLGSPAAPQSLAAVLHSR
jgi:hypothetical protein